jgi:hypothetical protein
MSKTGHDPKGVAGAFVLFAVIAFAGAVMAYAAVADYSAARASRNWPAVEGVVLSSGENGRSVRYTWFAGGNSHNGDRVRFFLAGPARPGVVYEPGKKVDVRVSPDDSSVAVLQPGGNAPLFALVIAFSAMLVFLGLAGVVRLAMLLDGLSAAPGRDYEYSPAE